MTHATALGVGRGSSAMGRTVVVLAIIAGVWLYVGYQYNRVVQQVTTKSTNPLLTTTSWPNGSTEAQESRRKCMICGGTGRSSFYSFSSTNPGRTEPCRACRGTGWVDNPMFGY